MNFCGAHGWRKSQCDICGKKWMSPSIFKWLKMSSWGFLSNTFPGLGEKFIEGKPTRKLSHQDQGSLEKILSAIIYRNIPRDADSMEETLVSLQWMAELNSLMISLGATFLLEAVIYALENICVSFTTMSAGNLCCWKEPAEVGRAPVLSL